MTLSRYLMWRIVAVSAAILALALALALGQAQSNIAHEERGAMQVARLLDHLGGLESGPSTSIERHLMALREINRSGQLRHLQLKLEDQHGQMLVRPVDDLPSSPLEVGYVRLLDWLHPLPQASPTIWTLQRGDGTRFRATLLIDPAGEQRESLAGVLGLLIVLCGSACAMAIATYAAVRAALRPMRDILHTIRDYESDDYSGRLPAQRLHELDTIASALNRMATAIERGRESRRQLSAKMITLQEDERLRIARELHDELGQVLTAMRADATWLQRRSATDPDTRAVADDLAGNCERVQHDIRDLLSRLRPLQRDDDDTPLPLNSLLDELVQSWRNRPGLETRLSLESQFDDDAVPHAVAVALYRLTQEALTNAIRHARASRVVVRVTRQRDVLQWQTMDDGEGIASTGQAMHHGNGLAGMCERVWALRGDIEIAGHGGIDGGLAVTVRLPLAATGN